mgnify:CR=1 FL=1
MFLTFGDVCQGVAEIEMLLDKLSASYRFGGPSSEWLLPLHSSIASEDQRKVFLRPPDNIRKVNPATLISCHHVFDRTVFVF